MEPLPETEASVPKQTAPRAYHLLMTGCGMVAAILFGLMAVLVCTDVALRNLFNTSIPWSVEMTEYMLMVAAFIAAPWLAYTNGHIRVDVLVRGLPDTARRLVAILGDALCLLICLVLAYKSVTGLSAGIKQGGLVFKVLIFPEWWLRIPITISFCLLSIEFIRRLMAYRNPTGAL